MSGVEIMCLWKRPGLFPADGVQMDIADAALRPGKPIRALVSYPRNAASHRLAMALIQVLAENDEACSGSFEKAKTLVKIGTGHADFQLVNGMAVWTPRSLSYAAMSQAEFALWLPVAIAFICQRLGTAPEHVRARVEEITGIPMREYLGRAA